MTFRGIGALELIVLIPLFLIGLVIYFLPSIIAAFRRHPSALAIFLIDLLLGWTFIGWVGALIWSFIPPGTVLLRSEAPGNALEIARVRYARGEITAAEFEEIKRNLI